MNTLVLSGINLFEGGPLSIYIDCLDYLINQKYYTQYNIIAFVHKKELFKRYAPYVQLMDLPNSREHYINRLYYEYIYFYLFSKNKEIDIWISLHDITPNVKAKKLYTYFHNPTPFMENPDSIKKNSKNIYYMAKYYKYIYKINIKKNTGIIVQQAWLRKKISEMFDISNIIVALPESDNSNKVYENINKVNDNSFIYAAYPRAFKNFEVICEAVVILEKMSIGFTVILTINGTENKYSKWLYQKYKHLKSIKWIGLQNRDRLFEIYTESDCMIFPSKLETWGLPITEYKKTNKPLLLADLPYAHETVGTYDKVCFFNSEDAGKLAELMKKFIFGTLTYDKSEKVNIEAPYAKNWSELFDLIGVKSECAPVKSQLQ